MEPQQMGQWAVFYIFPFVPSTQTSCFVPSNLLTILSKTNLSFMRPQPTPTPQIWASLLLCYFLSPSTVFT